MSNGDLWADWVQRKLAEARSGQQPPPGPHSGQQPRTGRPAFAESTGTENRDGHGGDQMALLSTRHTAPYPVPDRSSFGEHQGNAERRGGRAADESDPRRPSDPPWRGRTARRTSTPQATAAFRNARLRLGWTLTRAAEETGVSRPHLSLLERGLRRPSESVAVDIAIAYRMTPDEAEAVSAIAVPWAGRDSPYRTGDMPGEW